MGARSQSGAGRLNEIVSKEEIDLPIGLRG